MNIKLPSGVGLGLPHQNAENDPGYYDRVLEYFDVHWYNWLFDQVGDKYWNMLWDVKKAETYHDRIVAAESKSGHVWFLGNEPRNVGQSNTTIEEFATWVKWWKDNVGLPFALPGILWGARGKEWWNEYSKLDTPKPDAYHIHIYAWSAWEWKAQLQEALMTFHDRPLIITEAGGWGTSLKLQTDVMEEMYRATTLGWIPAAFWFSSAYGEYKPFWKHTDLFDENDKITAVGEEFDYWSKQKPHNIFLPYVSR